MKTKTVVIGGRALTISKFTMREISQALDLFNEYKSNQSIEIFKKMHDLTVDLVLSSLQRANASVTRAVVDEMDPEETYAVMAAIIEFSTPQNPFGGVRPN
jgi:seryl-tRNA(Sec) selenium transferase